MSEFSRDTMILESGSVLNDRRIDTPETAPIYLTTAFGVEDLDEVEALYAACPGACYEDQETHQPHYRHTCRRAGLGYGSKSTSVRIPAWVQ